jgi:transposase
VRGIRVWARLLGLARAVVEDVWLEDDAVVVVAVRPRSRERDRCPHCRRRCAGYDLGDGRRRWRALDLGTVLAYVEAAAPRVRCREHGVVVAAVPWARHDCSFTRAFADQAAWLAVNTSATAMAQLMRTTWRTVGWICRRVADEAGAQRDLFAGLRRIGVVAAAARLQVSAHTLRHTCLTELARRGNDLVMVAEFAGHQNLETTRRYTLPSAAERQAAVDGLQIDF